MHGHHADGRAQHALHSPGSSLNQWLYSEGTVLALMTIPSVVDLQLIGINSLLIAAPNASTQLSSVCKDITYNIWASR